MAYDPQRIGGAKTRHLTAVFNPRVKVSALKPVSIRDGTPRNIFGCATKLPGLPDKSLITPTNLELT